MKPKLILKTDPSGEQSLRQVEFELPVKHCLFTLSDTANFVITMTGEELDSLADQWLKWRKEDKPFGVTYEYTDAKGAKRKGSSVASGHNKADAIRQFKKSNRSVRNVKTI